MTRQMFVALAATVVLATACSGTATETTTVAETSTSTSSAVATTDATESGFDLSAALTTFVGDKDGGAVALTVRNGATSVAAAGVANSNGELLRATTPFRVGSISKTFTSVMVLQLVDEGLLDLDSSLSTYLLETPVGGDATIRSLLSHQTGIANYTDQPAFFADALADRDITLTPDQVLGYVADAPAGTVGEFSYSNTNYILLGQLVEKLGGQSLDTALQTRIVEPLGLASTSFVGGDVTTPADLAGGWSAGVSAGETLAPYESIASGAWAAGALVSTAEDLRGFMEALFGGQLISAASLSAMTEMGDAGYGFGLFQAQLGDNNPGYSHNGGIPGYVSTMGIAPGSGDLLVVLTNNDTLIPDAFAFTIVTNW